MGFLKFASDYEADQKSMQATADGLQSIVLTNSNIGPDIAGPWSDFYKQLSVFDSTPVFDLWTPFLPDPHFIATSGLADTFSTQANQLNQWVTTINHAAGSNIPGGLDPTGQTSSISANTLSLVKVAVAGIGILAAVYIVKVIKG